MRVVFTILVLASVFRLSAQEAGDVVVVTAANRAELKDEGQVITTCAHLVVERVSDEGEFEKAVEYQQRAYEFYSEADRQRLGYLTEPYRSGKTFQETPSE